MKKTRLLAAAAGSFASVIMAAPALAQSSSDDAAGAVVGIFTLVCSGIVGLFFLALFILWILMLVDVLKRDEADFPNSTGNSKTMWLIILLVSWLIGFYWLAAILYYFMVKRKANSMPKATMAPPTAPPPAPPTPEPPTPPEPPVPPTP